MHDCPVCGAACDCDGEDTWLNAPINCTCCPEGEPGDGDPDEDYELDDLPWEWHDNLFPDYDPSIYGFCPDCGRPTPVCVCPRARIWDYVDSPRTRRLHRIWKHERAQQRHQQMTNGKHVSRARRARKTRRA